MTTSFPGSFPWPEKRPWERGWVYDRNIFGNLRKFSGIFGNFRKMFENVRVTFEQVFENLRKPSESGRESSENRQKRRHLDVCIIKRTLHVSSKI